MPIRFIFYTVLSLATALPLAKAEPAKPSGSISILPSTSRLETLWEQGEFTEGVAIAPDGQVYFSDIPSSESTSGQILKFNPKTGKTTVFTAASEKSNGLMFDRDGRLIACCGANNGRMALSEFLPDGKLRTLSGMFDGKRYLAPNDLVILPNGLIYFSDPRYIGNEKEEQSQMAVYRYDPFSGEVTRAIGADQIEKPNGLALSPDGKTLYVAETNNGSTGGPNAPKNAKMGRMTLNAFPIRKNGSLGTKKVLVDFGDQAGIDGLTIDTMGNIYAAVRSAKRFGIAAYTPRGKEIAFIPTETLPTNCCFGVGADANTLYITAGIGLYRIKMNVSGYTQPQPLWPSGSTAVGFRCLTAIPPTAGHRAGGGIPQGRRWRIAFVLHEKCLGGVRRAGDRFRGTARGETTASIRGQGRSLQLRSRLPSDR